MNSNPKMYAIRQIIIRSPTLIRRVADVIVCQPDTSILTGGGGVGVGVGSGILFCLRLFRLD